MINQLSDCRPAARWPLAITASLMLALLVHAQDAAPPLPSYNFEHDRAYAVVQVDARCSVSLRVDTQERSVVLAGLSIPQSDHACAQLRQFLECLLIGEAVYIRPDLPTSIPQSGIPNPPACLFREPDGLFVNLEAVRQGYAKVCEKPTCEHLDLLRHYQQRARKVKKGIWAPPSVPGEARAARAAPAQPVPNAAEITVYVTKTGKKYHREGCQHLRKSARAITLKEALEKGYEPCSRCKPPTLEAP